MVSKKSYCPTSRVKCSNGQKFESKTIKREKKIDRNMRWALLTRTCWGSGTKNC